MAKAKLIKGRLFFRILQLSLIPMLIFSVISIIWYIFYVSQYESRLIEGYTDRIRSAVHEVNTSLTNILYSSNIVLDDKSIETISESGNILRPDIYMAVIEGCELLNYFRITNPLIRNVYFYHRYNNLLLSSDGTENMNRKELEKKFFSEKYNIPIPHSLGKVNLLYTGEHLSLVITKYRFDHLPDPLIIELDLTVIEWMVRKYTPTADSSVSMYIEDFGRLWDSGHDFSQEPLTLDRPGQNIWSADSFRKKTGGGIELYFRTPNTIWGTAAAATFIPSEDIRREFRFFHIIFLSILGTGLLIAFLITWMMSTALYRPVNTIINTIKKNDQNVIDSIYEKIKKEDLSAVSAHIENLLRDNIALKKEVTTLLPAASEHYLLALLQGSGEAESKLVTFLRNNNIVFDEPNFCAAICTIFPTQAFLKEHRFEEAEHLSHGLFRLLSNSLNPGEKLFTIHLEERKYALLFNVENDRDEQDVREKIEGVINIIEPERHLIKIHGGIGRIYMGLPGLQKSYSEAQRAETAAAALGRDALRVYQSYGKPHGLTFSKDEINRLENYLEHADLLKAELLCGDIIERNLKENIAEESLKELYLQFIFIALGVAENRNIINDVPVERSILALASSFKVLSIHEVKTKTRSYLETVCNLLKKNNGKIDPKKIITYIEENYSKDIYLDEMADRFGTSGSYISRYFKQTVGVNFHRYLSNIRIQEAKKLLRSTDRTISDISEAVGFNNRNIFLRMFKKLEGINPSDYRSLVRQ
jgi:AraC-like DNA-binding protein